MPPDEAEGALLSLPRETAGETPAELEPEMGSRPFDGMEKERASDIRGEMEPDEAAEALADLSEDAAREQRAFARLDVVIGWELGRTRGVTRRPGSFGFFVDLFWGSRLRHGTRRAVVSLGERRRARGIGKHKERVMGAFSLWHWIIVLVIAMVIFGPGKLGNIGKDLGKAVKDFKNAVNTDDAHYAAVEPRPAATTVQPPNAGAQTEATVHEATAVETGERGKA